VPASRAERDAAALRAADDGSVDFAVEAGELHEAVEPWRGSPHGLQNLLAVVAVICQNPLSISGWHRGMIDEVVEPVARRALGGRTAWPDGCTTFRG
jgi:hypothetical protein